MMRSRRDRAGHCHSSAEVGIVTTRKYMPETELEFFAVTAPGLEALTASELRTLGMKPRAIRNGGIELKGSMRDVYLANIALRTASRVLLRVATFHASSFHELERRASRMQWGLIAATSRPVSFRVTCRKSALYHSDAVAERLAAAATRAGIAVAASESADDEESGDAGQMVVVRLDHDRVSMSVDSSGELLHRRGYRQAIAKAPLRETIAAAMLIASGWRPESALLDPMCGSGTIPIEAALIARRIAPGLRRRFAFMDWAGFDATTWESVRDELRSAELPATPSVIQGRDRDGGGVVASMANATRAGVESDIDFAQGALSASEPASEHGWLITNPPYGIRVGTDVRNLYAKLGALIRTSFAGWRLGMLSASEALDRQLRVPLEEAFETRNGGIRVRFMRSVEGA